MGEEKEGDMDFSTLFFCFWRFPLVTRDPACGGGICSMSSMTQSYFNQMFEFLGRLLHWVLRIWVENSQVESEWKQSWLLLEKRFISTHKSFFQFIISTLPKSPCSPGRSGASFQEKFKLKYHLAKTKRHINKYCSKSKKPFVFCFRVIRHNI